MSGTLGPQPDPTSAATRLCVGSRVINASSGARGTARYCGRVAMLPRPTPASSAAVAAAAKVAPPDASVADIATLAALAIDPQAPVLCGVEWDGEDGYNDGARAGVRYFECEPRHGSFVDPEAVVVVTEADAAWAPEPAARRPSDGAAATPGVGSTSRGASATSPAMTAAEHVSARRARREAAACGPVATIEELSALAGRRVEAFEGDADADGVVWPRTGQRVLHAERQRAGSVAYVGPVAMKERPGSEDRADTIRPPAADPAALALETDPGAKRYIGVAWDAPDGMNDGSRAGIRYFDCAPLHGSFVLPAKLLAAEALEDLLVARYSMGPAPGSVPKGFLGGKPWERDPATGAFPNVRTVALGPGDADASAKVGFLRSPERLDLFPSLVDLSLKEALLAHWGDVALICAGLPRLERLNVGGNRLGPLGGSALAKALLSGQTAAWSRTVEVANFSAVGLRSAECVAAVVAALPSVESLSLASNTALALTVNRWHQPAASTGTAADGDDAASVGAAARRSVSQELERLILPPTATPPTDRPAASRRRISVDGAEAQPSTADTGGSRKPTDPAPAATGTIRSPAVPGALLTNVSLDHVPIGSVDAAVGFLGPALTATLEVLNLNSSGVGSLAIQLLPPQRNEIAAPPVGPKGAGFSEATNAVAPADDEEVAAAGPAAAAVGLSPLPRLHSLFVREAALTTLDGLAPLGDAVGYPALCKVCFSSPALVDAPPRPAPHRPRPASTAAAVAPAAAAGPGSVPAPASGADDGSPSGSQDGSPEDGRPQDAADAPTPACQRSAAAGAEARRRMVLTALPLRITSLNGAVIEPRERRTAEGYAVREAVNLEERLAEEAAVPAPAPAAGGAPAQGSPSAAGDVPVAPAAAAAADEALVMSRWLRQLLGAERERHPELFPVPGHSPPPGARACGGGGGGGGGGGWAGQPKRRMRELVQPVCAHIVHAGARAAAGLLKEHFMPLVHAAVDAAGPTRRRAEGAASDAGAATTTTDGDGGDSDCRVLDESRPDTALLPSTRRVLPLPQGGPTALHAVVAATVSVNMTVAELKTLLLSSHIPQCRADAGESEFAEALKKRKAEEETAAAAVHSGASGAAEPPVEGVEGGGLRVGGSGGGARQQAASAKQLLADAAASGLRPGEALVLHLLDAELMANPGAAARGFHCKELYPDSARLLNWRIAPGDHVVACIIPMAAAHLDATAPWTLHQVGKDEVPEKKGILSDR